MSLLLSCAESFVAKSLVEDSCWVGTVDGRDDMNRVVPLFGGCCWNSAFRTRIWLEEHSGIDWPIRQGRNANEHLERVVVVVADGNEKPWTCSNNATNTTSPNNSNPLQVRVDLDESFQRRIRLVLSIHPVIAAIMVMTTDALFSVVVVVGRFSVVSPPPLCR